MDTEIRLHQRNNTLTLVHLKRAGFGVAWVAGKATRDYLLKAGWIVTEISKIVDGVDCGTWTHCGSECCGPCPTCGDDFSLEYGYTTYLVSPGTICSNQTAKSLAHATMKAVDKSGLAANWRKHGSTTPKETKPLLEEYPKITGGE